MKVRTLRERPWNYYLSFTGAQSQDLASIPVVLDFEALTVSWWMKGPLVQHWSAVFSLVNIPQGKTVAFSYNGDRQCQLTLDNDIKEITSNHSFADSNWHHVLLAWDVKNGVLRFYVDGKVEFNDQSTQHSVPFPGGHLILGQSQNSSGSINESASLNADIKHFNMWQHMFTEQEALKIYSDCNVQIGTLVPWPEMQVALHGAVTRTEFNVSCLVKEKYHWPLTKLVNNRKLQERITSREGSVSRWIFTNHGVLDRKNAESANLGSYSGECLGNLDLCENGLSFSFWMNYKVFFGDSQILGLSDKYHNALRGWLAPLMSMNGRWDRCYSTSEYGGFKAETFHQKCNCKIGATVTLVKVGNFVFGGFSDQRLGGNTAQYLWNRRSFLFSIVNPAGLEPVKLDIRPGKTDKALWEDPQAGPVFGENDLYIGDNALQSAVSFSDLGHAYELPNSSFGAVPSHGINPKYSASGTHQNTTNAPYRARPSSPDPWCTMVDRVNQWLDIDLGSSQRIDQIELKKDDSDTKYVLTYKVSHSLRITGKYRPYNNSQVLDGQYPASVNISSARFIRFHPVTWHEAICMRVQLYKEENSSLIDLGVDNSSVIPDSSFKATSWQCMSTPYLAKDGTNRKCYGAWCGNGPSKWLQIDIGNGKELTKISTKGPNYGNPVPSYYLEYSLDGTTWHNYTQGG
ncbi:hypothetical protein OS493_027455 [Desmophyllum pertusum]|uniref:Uncharacterized protein n=1 Tax=Desmophyllum pertusum TaxID=174260 RepID=A0A9W9YAZ6_9CNID|nr:hypothetical protein OS493_027455 [Desmophyllum pertusum]